MPVTPTLSRAANVVLLGQKLTREQLESVESRFWAKVEKSEACWLWTAAKFRGGYGEFQLGRRAVRAHRVAYELVIGPILPGLQLDHLCRVRECVNPSHLEAVTAAENIRRGLGGAHNRVKTHCPRGHPYDEANTYITKRGHRACRKCDAAAKARTVRMRRGESSATGRYPG